MALLRKDYNEELHLLVDIFTYASCSKLRIEGQNFINTFLLKDDVEPSPKSESRVRVEVRSPEFISGQTYAQFLRLQFLFPMLIAIIKVDLQRVMDVGDRDLAKAGSNFIKEAKGLLKAHALKPGQLNHFDGPSKVSAILDKGLQKDAQQLFSRVSKENWRMLLK